MFTANNCEFDTEARDELNKALRTLLADADEDMYAHLEKSYSDQLNNAWREGITADELIKVVSRQRSKPARMPDLPSSHDAACCPTDPRICWVTPCANAGSNQHEKYNGP